MSYYDPRRDPNIPEMARRHEERARAAERKQKRFHAHLDECKQCRENPFGLCKIGAQLLTEAE